MAPLAQTLALLAMVLPSTAIRELPLDMAPNSFDDQYLNCGPAMARELSALNSSEFQQNKNFAQVWVKATAEWQERHSDSSPLSQAEAIALMAYTMEDVYEEFNTAVREAGKSSQEYRDNFHFKTLHFLLTQALQKLRNTQRPPCYHVYRGVRDHRFEAEQGDTVRFGQFASASLSIKSAQTFGVRTMFHVQTCHGKEIHEFSMYPGEKEVLIPPFETFKVIEVSQEGDKVLIQLRSSGTFSRYNCEWLRGGSIPMAPLHLGGLLLATTALAVATGIL